MQGRRSVTLQYDHNRSTVALRVELPSTWLVYVIPLFLFYLIAMWGLWHIPNTRWGMYDNTDGMWAAWNLKGILRWGRGLDLSPFNPLSGLGSMFLPNLPWFNPAALGLGLPFPRGLNYVISYTIYFTELCASNIILLRALGFSPLRSALGAQLYVLVLFPPSATVFVSLSWYSLAPVNAHLVAVANLMLVLFLVAGRYQFWGNFVCIVGLLALALVGLFSAPIGFLTYVPTYGSAAAVVLLGQRSNRPVLLWKIGAIAVVGTTVWLLGFPDYLKATVGMSARSDVYPPPFAAGAAMLSVNYWLDIWHRFDVCGQPQVLLCSKYRIFWFHALAVVGAAIQLFQGRSLLRSFAVVVPTLLRIHPFL